jgi:hypothetical protein
MRGNALPSDARYVEKRCNVFRRKLEAMVLAAKGTISLTDAAAINGALRWERFSALAAHWLRKEASSLSASDRLRFAEAMARGGDYRDKNIRLLNLDRDNETDLFDLALQGSSSTACRP